MKKIYFVLYTLSIGGAERHAATVANFLSCNNYKITIVLIENDSIQYKLNEGIEVVSLTKLHKNTQGFFFEKVKSKLTYTFLKNYAQIKDRFDYYRDSYINNLDTFFSNQSGLSDSIVVSFMTIPNICTSILKNKYSYQLILNEFTSPHLEFTEDSPENYLKKKYFPNADGFIFQTEEQRSFYTYLKNIKTAIIPNPIGDIKIQPYYGTRKKEIVNFCHFVKVKNLPLLIHAFEKLLNDYPEYSLSIYGDGPSKEGIKQIVERYNLSDNVNLMPADNNVLELVQKSAMFVSSSDREGISNSMLEAMAIGLPVICTDCPAGGARMMIKPYENGILVPVRDPEAMYQAMKFMIEHPDKAEEMGRNAVAIRETLEKGKILKQWLSFIESL